MAGELVQQVFMPAPKTLYARLEMAYAESDLQALRKLAWIYHMPDHLRAWALYIISNSTYPSQNELEMLVAQGQPATLHNETEQAFVRHLDFSLRERLISPGQYAWCLSVFHNANIAQTAESLEKAKAIYQQLSSSMPLKFSSN